jgi:tRNA (cmo5U34)-methyltransferase
MSTVWNAESYDSERRRLVPCFDEFYGVVVELVARFCADSPRILDLGAGTGILSAAIVDRVANAQLHLLDASSEMLDKASKRLSGQHFELSVQSLDSDLPPGPFHAIVSALAIHHLTDLDKRNLYSSVLSSLTPGGIFINAEQVSGSSPRLQNLFEAVHLDRARALGSSQAEIAGALERMSYDRCATASDQIQWLDDLGFEDVDCFYRSFRFAVFGGWKPKLSLPTN